MTWFMRGTTAEFVSYTRVITRSRRKRTDDNGDGVEVVEQIVGDTVSPHTGGEGVGSSTEGTVVDVVDGKEEEDTASLEGTADILNELIIIVVNLGATSSSAHAGLGNFPESLAADGLEPTVREAVTKNAEDIAQIGTARRLLDKSGVKVPQKRRKQKVKNGRNQVGSPVADKLGQIGSGDTKAGTDVDEKVEPQHDAVEGLLRVDNDALAILLDNVSNLVGGLVHDGGRNVGLELGGANGEHVEREGEGTDSVTRGEDRRKSRDDHDNVGNTANGDTLANHAETTILGIGEPAEEDGEGIRQELESFRHGGGSDGAPAESTGRVVLVEDSGTGFGTLGQGSTDEVLVDLEAAVVRGTLGELDGAEVVAFGRHLSGHTAERLLLLLGGQDKAVVFLADISAVEAFAAGVGVGGRGLEILRRAHLADRAGGRRDSGVSLRCMFVSACPVDLSKG